MSQGTRIGWHFLSDDGLLRFGDYRKPRKGEWVKMLGFGNPILNQIGMHASQTVLDALNYAPGSLLCRVKVRGDIVSDGNKFAGRERLIIARADATRMLHEFACDCAMIALKVAKNTNQQSLSAINIKRRWLSCNASDLELSNAFESASEAAMDANYGVDWAALWTVFWATSCSPLTSAFNAASSCAVASSIVASCPSAGSEAWNIAWAERSRDLEERAMKHFGICR